MNSKDKFNPEKWNSIDEVTPSSVPKYEFEETDNKQTKNFSANDWFVENEGSIDERIDKLKEKAEVQQGDSINTVNNKDGNNTTNSVSSHSKLKRVTAIVLTIIAIIAIPSVLLAINQVSDNYNSYNDEEAIISTTITTSTTTTTTTEYVEPDYWEGECGDNASFYIQYETDDNGKKYLTLNIEGTGAMWSCENIDWKIEDTSRVERIFVLNDISTIPENEFGEFTGVKYVYIMDSVKSIGKWAFDGLNSLKEIWIYNRDCKINYVYTDDDGSTRYAWTLGSPKNKVEIVCIENSTAEDYVNTFNNETDTPGYEMAYIVTD